MAAAYFESELRTAATFELFVRRLPPHRSYLVCAGLEQALEWLENARFKPEEIDYLRRHPAFAKVGAAFFDYLRDFRFSGKVWAVPEGTPVFAQEPLLRVTAPIIEAQIAETFLLTTITFQTMIASKAARVVESAQGRGVVEFGTRRAHGPEAGSLAARAAYIGGCIGTSNVEAGMRFGIPTYGTLAHSFVTAFEREEDAFRQMEKIFPGSVLLVDTYDTLEAVEKIIALGLRPRGVRLDSGDLVELSKAVRKRLDHGGLTETSIFASGDLDEFAIADLLAKGASINSFGVGTELATSRDAPALSGVYKLVEVGSGEQRHYRMKLSHDKINYPGAKQVFRFSDLRGEYDYDLVACDYEEYPQAEPLLVRVMEGGKPLGWLPPLEEIRRRAGEVLARMPAQYRQLRGASSYPVRISPCLQDLADRERRRRRKELASD